MSSFPTAFQPYGYDNGKILAPFTFMGGITVASGATIDTLTITGTANIPAIGITSINGWVPNFIVNDATTLSAGGSGFAAGDTVTLANGVVIGVTSVSGGAITNWVVINRGSTTTVPTNPQVQTATSGSGTGASFNVFWVPATYVNSGSLTTNSGNLIIGGETPNAAFAGTECTFVGVRAGGKLIGGSFNTSLGHNALGIGGASTFSANNVTAIGCDAARNAQATCDGSTIVGAGTAQGLAGARNTVLGQGSATNLSTGIQNTFVGQGNSTVTTTGSGNVVIGYGSKLTAANAANAVVIGSFNGGGQTGTCGTDSSVIVGGQAASANITGLNNTFIGAYTGQAVTSGANNTILGRSVAGATLATGSNNVYIGTNSSLDATTSSTSNEIKIGAGSTAVIKATGCGTPTTAVVTTSGPTILSGAGFTVAGLPAASAALQGARTFVTDASTATPSFMATLTGGGSAFVPVFCDGTVWRYG